MGAKWCFSILMCLGKIWGSPLNADADLVGLGWDLKCCTSNKHIGDTDAAGLRTMLWLASTWIKDGELNTMKNALQWKKLAIIGVHPIYVFGRILSLLAVTLSVILELAQYRFLSLTIPVTLPLEESWWELMGPLVLIPLRPFMPQLQLNPPAGNQKTQLWTWLVSAYHLLSWVNGLPEETLQPCTALVLVSIRHKML